MHLGHKIMPIEGLLNMLSRLRFLARSNRITTDDFNKVIERVNMLSNINGGGGVGTRVNSGGINIFNTTASAGGTALGLYEVGSAVSGDDGIYNCFPVKIDATNWGSDGNVDKVSSLPAWSGVTAYAVSDVVINDDVSYICTTAHTNNEPPHANWSVADTQILNLQESYCLTAYVPALALYDLISAWSVSDDEGNSRTIGVPIGTKIRTAQTREAAQNDDSIQCDLILRDGGAAVSGELGYDIEVFGHVNDGTADFDDSVPRYATGQTVAVYNQMGKWFLADTLQASEDCVCS